MAKGAAWSVPAVALASSAPALAASPTCTYKLVESCPASPMRIQTGGSTSLTIFVRDVAAGAYFPGGTSYGLNLGQWVVDDLPMYTEVCSGVTTTKQASGFYLNWGSFGGSCDKAPGNGPAGTVTNGNGDTFQGYVSSSSPVACSPQAAGAGLTASVRVATSIPYNGLRVCFSDMNLGKVSLPFTITYLQGLTPLASCSYNLNLQFKTGCQPNQQATGYTITPA